ncbi:MAG: hypothetical protein U0521_11480 [Anaerolineae bacterium]
MRACFDGDEARRRLVRAAHQPPQIEDGQRHAPDDRRSKNPDRRASDRLDSCGRMTSTT